MLTLEQKGVLAVLRGETTLEEGQSAQMNAQVYPDNATVKEIVWQNDNGTADIAKVNPNTGAVVALKRGIATIRARVGYGHTSSRGWIYTTKNITVLHPFTVDFKVNTPSSDQVPHLSATSVKAYYGPNGEVEVETFPTASCDYYDFLGWYTSPNGGTRVTEQTLQGTDDASITLYAHWRIHEESDWVLPEEVPEGAKIVSTSYSWHEETESTEASMGGWIPDGDYWKVTGSGSTDYISFPSGFDKGNNLYVQYNNSPYSPKNDGNSKREVANSRVSYIYWHWMYSTVANAYDRAIYYQKGYPSQGATGNNLYYDVFGAFKSDNAYEKLNGQNWNQGDGIYAWYVVTDRNWTLYNYMGQMNTVAMSRAYRLNVLSTVALKHVDALRLFSECQGTFKGYFADIKYYRDEDGFIFPATYNYSQYESAKTGDDANGGGGSAGFR